LELEVCRQYQIPYSHFQGGPRRWTETDRGKALSYEQYLRTICPRCGTRKEDFFYEDEDGVFQPLEEPMYFAVHRSCKGCEDHNDVDKVLTEDQRKRGMFTAWVPNTDFDEDAEEVFEQTPNVREMKLPGLE
jgi:hypothetical protein